VRREFFAEARYANQLWELDVSLGDRDYFDGPSDVAALGEAFDRLHEAVFAVNQPGEALEAVSWRGDVRIARPKPALPSRDVDPAADGTIIARRVWFDGAWREIAVYNGSDLPRDASVDGPAIIEEPTTTIVLPAGSVATVRSGHYLVEVGS
jgi:N-methylhydantoinase A